MHNVDIDNGMPFISNIFRYTLADTLRFFICSYLKICGTIKTAKIGSRSITPIKIHWHLTSANMKRKFQYGNEFFTKNWINLWIPIFGTRYILACNWTLWRPKKNCKLFCKSKKWMLEPVQVTNNLALLLSFSFLFCRRFSMPPNWNLILPFAVWFVCEWGLILLKFIIAQKQKNRQTAKIEEHTRKQSNGIIMDAHACCRSKWVWVSSAFIAPTSWSSPPFPMCEWIYYNNSAIKYNLVY